MPGMLQAEKGCKTILIKSNDTDVLVIVVSVLPILHETGLQQLWIAFGQGQNMRWIPIHELVLSIGLQKSKGILFFHAFTGCDVVSAFRGKCKKTAWQTWDVFDEASDVVSKLSQYLPTIDDADMKILENFVVMMYDRSSRADGGDDARLDMFAREAEAIRSHPSYPCCSTPACKACCLPSGMHMGSINTLSARGTKSCRLGHL